MSLDIFVQSDSNPTPTRFLLECGAFAPSLNLDSYNPFDSSIKFLTTSTPKSEHNPFDSSFHSMDAETMTSTEQRPATTAASTAATHGHHSWMGLLDDSTISMPPFSPGFSVSSSTDSPSSPLDSPVAMTASLSTIQKSNSMPVSSPTTNMLTLSAVSDLDRQRRDSALFLEGMDYDMTKKGSNQTADDRNYLIDRAVEEDDHDNGHGTDPAEDASMESDGDESLTYSYPTSKKNSSTLSSKKSAKSKAKSSPQASKAATTSSTSASRKRRSISSTEEETTEDKRQRFLERNRQAASRCREKKRLQTLKIIHDADEVAAKNQRLHKEFKELQEEIRELKNQILCHRDCGCDVIQKFVQSSSFAFPTSFMSTNNSTTTANTAAMAPPVPVPAPAAIPATTCMTMPMAMPLSVPMSIPGTVPMAMPDTTATTMHCSATGQAITTYPMQIPQSVNAPLPPSHLPIAPAATATTYYPAQVTAFAVQQPQQQYLF